ncbi:uncharacterized protein [Clytia hemisphaerica]|uniref:Uncharacterized protein n=1 Tax=Clytia hemisphaerica TaxID=252671 RepID=A0A7M5V454_9CNID
MMDNNDLVDSEDSDDYYDDEYQTEMNSDAESESELGFSTMENLAVLLDSIKDKSTSDDTLGKIKAEISSTLLQASKTRRRYFGFLLENSYDLAKFEEGSSMLKGNDKLIWNMVKAANKDFFSEDQFTFYLTMIYRKKTGKLDFRRRRVHGEKDYNYVYKTGLDVGIRMHDGQRFDFNGLPFDVMDDLIGYNTKGSFSWGEADKSTNDSNENFDADNSPELYSKTIILAIPKKHHFSSLCRSQKPNQCIKYLLEETDLKSPELTEHINTLLKVFPVKSYQGDSKVINGTGNLLLKAGDVQKNISFLKQIFKFVEKKKRKKDVFVFQEGTEKVIGELMKSISWESIRESVENAITLTEPLQYKSWMDVASIADNSDLANIIIELSHAQLYDDYIEVLLWEKIFHEVCKSKCLNERWFKTLLNDESIRIDFVISSKFAIEAIKSENKTLYPSISTLLRNTIKSTEDLIYIDEEILPGVLRDIFEVLFNYYDQFSSELKELVTCLLDKNYHFMVGKALLKLSVLNFPNPEGFEMVYEKSLDSFITECDEIEEEFEDELMDAIKIFIQRNIVNSTLFIKLFKFVCKTMGESCISDIIIKIMEQCSISEKNSSIDFLEQLIQHYITLIKNDRYVDSEMMASLLIVLLKTKEESLSKYLKDLVESKPISEKILVSQTTLSSIFSVTNQKSFSGFTASKYFRVILTSYVNIINTKPTKSNQLPTPDTYKSVLIYLVTNCDWPSSIELLRILLDSEFYKKDFDISMFCLSQLKCRNTEPYKMFLKSTVDALNAYLNDEEDSKDVPDFIYQHILKFVRILFKNDCFTDILLYLLSSEAFQANGKIDSVAMKDYSSLLQRLISDLKRDFNTDKPYGQLMLIRVQNLEFKSVKPKLTWKQPTSDIFQNHLLVNDFLRSERDTFIYRDAFTTTEDARRWVRSYSFDRIFTAVIRNNNGVVEVLLQKHQEQYEKEKKYYFKNMAELHRLKRKLKLHFPELYIQHNNKRLLQNDCSGVP